MKGKRVGIITNHWGWTLRGLRHWFSTFAFPYTCHGSEVTTDVPPVYRVDRHGSRRLAVYDRIVRVGFVWFKVSRVTQGYSNGTPTYFDASGSRVLKYPYGRLQRWRTERRNAQIDRDNRRRADERAMREGCS